MFTVPAARFRIPPPFLGDEFPPSVADNFLDHRLDMRGDELREGCVSLFVTGRQQ
jgi:hypothetical protein